MRPYPPILSRVVYSFIHQVSAMISDSFLLIKRYSKLSQNSFFIIVSHYPSLKWLKKKISRMIGKNNFKTS